MKRNFTLTTIFILLAILPSQSQTTDDGDTVADIQCAPSHFYAPVGVNIKRFSKVGSTITDLGIYATSTFSSLFSVAYANDFMNGSTNRTLYSSESDFVTSTHTARKYDGTNWITVATSPGVLHQCGGYGNYVYYMHTNIPGQPNDQFVARLGANGTLTSIFTDTTLLFTVADLEVDSAGNVYFFRGPAIGNTTELTVTDSLGNIIQQYTCGAGFPGLSTIYGMMFFNGDLFVGQGTSNSQLLPVIFSGNTVSLGTGIPTPNGVSLKDLDACHDMIEPGSTDGIEELSQQQIQVYPNPASHTITLNSQKPCDVEIYDVRGSLVLKKEKVISLDISALKAGMYYLLTEKGNATFLKE